MDVAPTDETAATEIHQYLHLVRDGDDWSIVNTLGART